MIRRVIPVLLALALLAQPADSTARLRHAPHTARTDANRAAAKRGFRMAQDHCAACHGITANASSPNPEAPPWDAVVNKPGLTRATLAQFLRDSHNYPDAMNFRIDPARINDLAAYMITLQRPNFHPPI